MQADPLRMSCLAAGTPILNAAWSPTPLTLNPLIGQSTPQCSLLTTKEQSLPRLRLNEITRRVTGYMPAACCRP